MVKTFSGQASADRRTAAHFHAFCWYSARRTDDGAVAFADENWNKFAAAATVELGRILNKRDRTAAELAAILDVMESYGEPASANSGYPRETAPRTVCN